ncbi:hypothetical protein PVAP13_1NG338700 [Panicum virgatum]|uniref:Chloroplast envelope membrane protein n=1 Tax=Panicum virgatum TaxID=38727 RepID=A0A8T0WSE8_PANVG|nr:hypothetical protein PVAP13_1NG338700 [Panicum virgatum]
MIQISIHPKLLTPIHPLHSGVVPSPPSKTESECSVLLTIATFSLLPGSLGFLRYPKGKNVVMLELGSLTAALPRSRLSSSGPQVHLFSYFSLSLEEKLSPGLLPCSTSSFPGGDDWASGGPTLCRRRAHPPGAFALVFQVPLGLGTCDRRFMTFMSCCAVSFNSIALRLLVEDMIQRQGTCACKMFTLGSHRKRVRHPVVFAKKRRRPKKWESPWWKPFFSDWNDDEENLAGLKEDDESFEEIGSDQELSENEKFETWRRKAEAIVELREAQQDAMNAEERSWEDWISGGSTSGGGDWGGDVSVLDQITDDPAEILRDKSAIEVFGDSIDEDYDDMLLEDRVFMYASTNSAKFLALLIVVPWVIDFLVHDYVMMPFLERLELRDEWRLENRNAFANIWSDMVYGIVLFLLICFNPSKVAMLKFTGYKLLNNISDSGKAFLIILVSDILLGYHSEPGWHTMVEVILEHYGLEADQAAVTFFVCLVPVAFDVLIKFWVYKYLPRLSPSVGNILDEITRH